MGLIGYEGLLFFGLLISLFVIFYLLACHNDIYSEQNYYNRQKEEQKEEADKRTVELKQFVPYELFEVLGIEDTEKLTLEKLKEPRSLTAGMLYADMDGFLSSVETMPPGTAYQYIRGAQERCMPCVLDAGGIITDFNGSGINALFAGEPESGLRAAIAMCEAMAAGGGGSDPYPAFAVGLYYGNVTVGVVGDIRRLLLSVLSAYTRHGVFMQRIASRYYSRIIVTGSYLQQIRDFEKKYNYRFLGYLYAQNTDTLERMFDIFDGDIPEIRNKKRKTRTMFEKGVNLYINRKLSEARVYFIEVLKMDHGDKAAKEYVLRCDQYSSMENGNEIPIYLEKC